jgi:hypothetical protein
VENLNRLLPATATWVEGADNAAEDSFDRFICGCMIELPKPAAICASALAFGSGFAGTLSNHSIGGFTQVGGFALPVFFGGFDAKAAEAGRSNISDKARTCDLRKYGLLVATYC